LWVILYNITVDDIHTIYVEECGNPNGMPILFLHGGPGAGLAPEHRRFFNPDKYRIILFDQRGCGKSTPHGEIRNNTTNDLISDMEKIREHCKIPMWVIFGGSWGSTLALAYAQVHTTKVSGLILRGIFLCRKKDLDWFYKDGASRVFPDYWQEFISHIPAKEKVTCYIKAYSDLLHGENELAKISAAKAWSKWEAICSTLRPSPKAVEQFTHPHMALSLATMESHYFLNNIFLKENSLLNNMDKLQDIPGVIVHGRYDLICPLQNAYALKNAWPTAEFKIIREAGHSAFEPGIVDGLIRATIKFAR